MTAIADFDIANDLKVEFFVPRGDDIFIIGISKLGSTDLLDTASAFVIGESLLGGPDILGGSGFEWRDLTCTVAQVEMSIGGSVQNEIYFQPEPATANMLLQSYEYDPSVNSSFRPGTRCRLRLERDAFSQIIFQGFIDNIEGSYVVDGKNRLQVSAYDNYKRIANTRIELFDTDTDFPAGYVTPYEQLEVIAEQVGTAMHSSSVESNGKIPSTIDSQIIPGSKMFEAIQVGLGMFWLDPETEEFVFIPRPSTLSPVDPYIIGNNHGEARHLCMSDIKTKADGDVVFNSLKVALDSDPSTSVLVENTDSIQLYGKFAVDVVLNTTDAVELERWSSEVFTQSPTDLVESVETPAIDRTNNLTQAAFFKPGAIVGVKYNQDLLAIDEYYITTKVSHYIDADSWLTTLNLWKES